MSYHDQYEQAQIEYPGNGTQVLFTFPFTYMKPTDICVEFYDESTREWAKVSSDLWSFANATTIEFLTAPATPTGTGVSNIRIVRQTDLDPLAQFNPGSAIRAVDLNDNFEKLKLAIEEGRTEIDDLGGDYWSKSSSSTTYSTDTWSSETDDSHVPTTKAVQDQITAELEAAGVEPAMTYTAEADSATLTLTPGGDVTILPAATTTAAGLLTAGDKATLDTVAHPTQVYTAAPDSGTLTLSPGGDTTTLPVVTTDNAGLMSAEDKSTLDGLSNAPAGGVASVSEGDGISITGSAAVPIVNVVFGTVDAGQTPTTVMPYDIGALQTLP